MRRKSLFLLSFYVFAQITSLLILVQSLDVFVCFTCCPWSYLRYTPSCTIQFVIEWFIMHCITILIERHSCVIANPKLKNFTKYILKTAVFIFATSALANLVKTNILNNNQIRETVAAALSTIVCLYKKYN